LENEVDVKVVCPQCEEQEIHTFLGPYKEPAVCSSCNSEFDFILANTRAKKSRGNKKEGSREFDIRIILDDKSEEFYQFTNSSYDDIELRSKDRVVLVFVDGNIRVVQNIEIGSYAIISDPSCFVATYLYGSKSSEVIFLRAWRDDFLKKSYPGKVFIRCYYFFSPHLIRHAGNLSSFNFFAKFLVKKILYFIGYKNT
jgi:hypothetical protein